MNDWGEAEVAAEVVGGRAALASKCGIPAADIVGWRQPYLQASPTVRQVCDAAGTGPGSWKGLRHGTCSSEQAACTLLGCRRCRRPPLASGFCDRCPLSAALGCMQAVKAAGFWYDSTILESPDGESASRGTAARLWPYTLQDGVAQDCKRWAPGLGGAPHRAGARRQWDRRSAAPQHSTCLELRQP